MATPPVPQDFLEHCVKYEYFKRNTAMQAHLNVCELVDRWHSKGPYTGIPKVKLEPEENPDDSSDMVPGPSDDPGNKVKKPQKSQIKATPPKKAKKAYSLVPPRIVPDTDDHIQLVRRPPPAHTVKRKIPNGSSPERSRRVLLDEDASDRDSDDPDMFIEMPDNSNQREQCTLMKTRNLYETFAEIELLEMERRQGASFAQVMCMQRIAKTKYIQILNSTNTSSDIRTFNRYRKLTIVVGRRVYEKGQKEEIHITYMSSRKGCLIWYGDDLKVDNTIKYQSLAAKDFSYLVKDKCSLFFGQLDFEAPPYRKCDPAIWPFGSFYFKINKYLAGRELLKVTKLCMRVFNNRRSTENGQAILMDVINFLDPKNLVEMRIRVWDDSEVIARRRNVIPIEGELLNVLYDTPQWKKMHNLDFARPQIIILSYQSFTHFVKVQVIGQNDFEPLKAAYAKLEGVTRNHSSTFYVNNEFNFTALQEPATFDLKNNVQVKIEADNGRIVFVW